jgi:hypothetical protein
MYISLNLLEMIWARFFCISTKPRKKELHLGFCNLFEMLKNVNIWPFLSTFRLWTDMRYFKPRVNAISPQSVSQLPDMELVLHSIDHAKV